MQKRKKLTEKKEEQRLRRGNVNIDLMYLAFLAPDDQRPEEREDQRPKEPEDMRPKESM